MKTGKAMSVPAGLGLSLVVNVSITSMAVAIITILLNYNSITWENTGYWIMGMLLISSYFGGKVAINSIKTQVYIVSLMSGILYWMFMLCITALFFGGQYNSIFETGVLIIAGSISAALLHLPKKRNSIQRSRHSHR